MIIQNRAPIQRPLGVYLYRNREVHFMRCLQSASIYYSSSNVLFFAKVQGREWHLAANWLTGPTRKAKENIAAAAETWPSPSDPVTQSSSHPVSK